jgi:curved DNA-binding protein CbpA
MRLGRELLGTDWYAILGVARSATPAEIRAAYRARVRRSHPDLNRENRERAERETVLLNVAASVLLRPDWRREYDRQGGGLSRCETAWYERASDDGAWYDAPPDAAVSPEGSHDPEIEQLCRRLRRWPAGTLQRVAQETQRWSSSTRLSVAVSCCVFAVVLLGAAQPTSLLPARALHASAPAATTKAP